jgi:hypothetical protein
MGQRHWSGRLKHGSPEVNFAGEDCDDGSALRRNLCQRTPTLTGSRELFHSLAQDE